MIMHSHFSTINKLHHPFSQIIVRLNQFAYITNAQLCTPTPLIWLSNRYQLVPIGTAHAHKRGQEPYSPMHYHSYLEKKTSSDLDLGTLSLELDTISASAEHIYRAMLNHLKQ